jgi:hypothetical protein
MPPPRSTNAYPVEFRAALTRAISTGSLFIPHANPSALRLRFYGYIGALRKEGENELADACSFTLSKSPPGLTLNLRETTPDAAAIREAIGTPTPNPSTENPLLESDDIDSLFNRIIGQ